MCSCCSLGTSPKRLRHSSASFASKAAVSYCLYLSRVTGANRSMGIPVSTDWMIPTKSWLPMSPTNDRWSDDRPSEADSGRARQSDAHAAAHRPALLRIRGSLFLGRVSGGDQSVAPPYADGHQLRGPIRSD